MDYIAAEREAKTYAAATKRQENQRRESTQSTTQPKEQRKPRRRAPRQRKEPQITPRQATPRQSELRPRRTKNTKKNQTEHFNQEKSTRQYLKTILPEILIPLVNILIQVTTIPGDFEGKLTRVSEVVRDAIQKACEENLSAEDSTEDEDYIPQFEVSEGSETESEDSESDMETVEDIQDEDEQQRPGRTH